MYSRTIYHVFSPKNVLFCAKPNQGAASRIKAQVRRDDWNSPMETIKTGKATVIYVERAGHE